MSNGAWVCFYCRNAVRRSNQLKEDVPCAECGKPREYIGYKIPVPPKNKEKEWKALFEQHFSSKLERLLEIEREHVRRRHELEHEITRLEAMPDNPGRTRTISLLRKQLQQYQN